MLDPPLLVTRRTQSDFRECHVSEPSVVHEPSRASMRQEQPLLRGGRVKRDLDSLKHHAHPFSYLVGEYNAQ